MGDDATLLRSAAGLFWAWVPPAALQATALLVAATLADRLLPRGALPQLREALWTVALAKLILPPTWISPFALPVELPTLSDFTVRALGPASTALVTNDPSPWALPVAGVWVAGVALGALTWALRARTIGRDLRARRTAPDPEALEALARACTRLGRKQAPALFRIDGGGSPFVAGVLRPAIHLPKTVAVRELEHVLLHELAHVERRDGVRRAAGALVHLLFWFHPLLPFARRRLAAASEAACDRRVARALAQHAPAYRATLLDFYRRAAASEPGIAFVAPPTALRLRLEAIARASTPPSALQRSGGALLVALFLAAAVPLAARAERASLEVADWIVRPPGCLQLRYLVYQRLAAEARAAGALAPER